MSNSKQYDLEDRTLQYSKKVIELCRELPVGDINRRLKDQLLRSATSIGANYREVNETDTKKDFKNRIRIAKKEAKETVYWLELLLELNSQFDYKIRLLLKETNEFVKILAAIYFKIK